MEQRAKQMMCWAEPFVKLRLPKMFNLRRNPFERADENSNTYWDWVISRGYLLYEMQALLAQQIENFAKFPPRKKPASSNLDEVLRNPGRERRRPPLGRRSFCVMAAAPETEACLSFLSWAPDCSCCR